MKKNKIIIIAAVVIVIIAAVLAAVLLSDAGTGSGKTPASGEVEAAIESGIVGIEAVSADNIAGIFVEDGSDEVCEGIGTLTLTNTAAQTLQYAELVLSACGEDYHFKVTTVPAGETVRVMESDRKQLPSKLGDCTLSADNVAWFNTEPSMYANIFSVEPQDGGLIITNNTDATIAAPIYVYYKNYTDGMYIGGITYRAVLQQELKAGESAAVSAIHLDPDGSRLMFISYVP